MQVDVTFRNIAPSEALRTYARDKIGRIKRYLPKTMDAHVTLTLDGFRNVAESSLRGPGATLTAKESSTADMYAAIDLLSDKLAKQARRHNDKGRARRNARPEPVQEPDEGDAP